MQERNNDWNHKKGFQQSVMNYERLLCSCILPSLTNKI